MSWENHKKGAKKDRKKSLPANKQNCPSSCNNGVNLKRIINYIISFPVQTIRLVETDHSGPFLFWKTR